MRLVKSSFGQRLGRPSQAYSVLWKSLFLSLGVAYFATSNQASAQELSQSKLVSLFETVCLKSGADQTAAIRAAKRLGLKEVSPHQYSDAKTTLNVHFLSSDKVSWRGEISTSKIDGGSWDTVAFSVANLATFKGKGSGCVVSAYNVPLERLAAAAAPMVAKYEGQMKVKSRGRVGQADVILNERKARIFTRPLKISSQLRFVVLSVVRSQ
jgi:hypothetical protein